MLSLVYTIRTQLKLTSSYHFKYRLKWKTESSVVTRTFKGGADNRFNPEIKALEPVDNLVVTNCNFLMDSSYRDVLSQR